VPLFKEKGVSSNLIDCKIFLSGTDIPANTDKIPEHGKCGLFCYDIFISGIRLTREKMSGLIDYLLTQ